MNWNNLPNVAKNFYKKLLVSAVHTYVITILVRSSVFFSVLIISFFEFGSSGFGGSTVRFFCEVTIEPLA